MEGMYRQRLITFHVPFFTAVDYCRQIRAENKQLQRETEKLRQEISQLTGEIR